MTALYICYSSVNEPLVHTQVLPYLSHLARDGVRLHLLTFERGRPDARAAAAIVRRLAALGIDWHWLRYHQWPSLPATMWDTVLGTLHGARLARRLNVNLVHARSHVPAAMGLAIKRMCGTKLLFDVRGLLAEEYEDAGRWRREQLAFRMTKAMERRCLRAAAAVVVLTERARQLLLREGEVNGASVTVIPCCVDTQRFRGEERMRESLRQELGVQDRTVLVYLGKLGSWYLADAMVDFFTIARQVMPRLHFLAITQSDHDMARREFARCGITDSDYSLITVPPEQVPAYLSAADAGISFIRPCYSKLASSPTKLGEYLAAGLPVVTNSGIGDCDALFEQAPVGAIVSRFDSASYGEAAKQLQSLLSDRLTTARRCRELAESQLSLQNVGAIRYRAVYRGLRSDQDS